MSLRCTLPLLKGDGIYKIKSYGYDPVGRQCVEFEFSGLGGNQNKFITKSDCEIHCGKRRELCKKDVTCQLNCPYGKDTNDYGCEKCSCKRNPCDVSRKVLN